MPDRLEQAVGEAEGEDVLRRLLAEEVVDPEDLLLVEHLVQLGVERDRGGVVGAERLLHDDPAALDEVGLGDGAHRGERGLRRHREVVQPLVDVARQLLGLSRATASRGPRPGRRAARSRAAGRTRASRHPHLAGAVLADGDEGEVTEGVAVELVEGGAHDAQVVDEPGLEQVQQPGDELRLARSPVAPNRTTVVGGHGASTSATWPTATVTASTRAASAPGRSSTP